MNIVFIHPMFPGQFGPLAEFLGRDKNNNVIFITSEKAGKKIQIQGIRKIIFSDAAPPQEGDAEQQVPKISPGLAVANVLADLKKKGVVPDLIIGRSGPGTSFHVKDVFPAAPFLGFFDWFHRPENLAAESGETKSPDLKLRMTLRNRNLPVLADLHACDLGICPSEWQKSQFPAEFRGKLVVVHNGVDTNVFQAQPGRKFKTAGLDLSSADQFVTYTANVLAPYKGFDQFMGALPLILAKKPNAHAVIVGADRVSFKDREGNKKSYKSVILEKINPDPGRIHFLDDLEFESYRSLLQVSTVHVYLDSPLVVSRSLLEAMACECLVVAPDSRSVSEVIKDGNNGIISDFSSAEKVSEKICACLDYPSFMEKVKEKARKTIIEQYNLGNTVLNQMSVVERLIKRQKQPGRFG